MKDFNIVVKFSLFKRLFFIRGIVYFLLEVRIIYSVYENFKNLYVYLFFYLCIFYLFFIFLFIKCIWGFFKLLFRFRKKIFFEV